LVLCGWDEVSENPMSERLDVRFVRGDLTGADVMGRVCVARAATAIVDGRDDNESLAIALAVDHVNPDVHMVVALRRREQLRNANPRIQCVQWHMSNLVTEEALDPGITEIYADLMAYKILWRMYSGTAHGDLVDQRGVLEAPHVGWRHAERAADGHGAVHPLGQRVDPLLRVACRITR
jgi:voltage-gated potassium channel